MNGELNLKKPDPIKTEGYKYNALIPNTQVGVVHSTRLSEVRHSVLALLGAAQDHRPALFERSVFALTPVVHLSST